MRSFDTIAKLIEGGFSVSAHCFAFGCHHQAPIDLQVLAGRLGPDFVMVGNPNPLVKFLRCQKCGGKQVGLILLPRTGYTDGPAGNGPWFSEPSGERPTGRLKRARRRVRL